MMIEFANLGVGPPPPQRLAPRPEDAMKNLLFAKPALIELY